MSNLETSGKSIIGITRAIIAILLGLLFSASVPAPASAAFETLGQGTRASAMGHAYAVQADDASALWYNTAGLANSQRRQVLIDYARLFPGLDVGPDINAWAVNYVQGLAGGHLGLGVAGTGAGFYRENGAVLGYGRGWGKRLSLGLGLRLLRWSAEGYRDPVNNVADPDRAGTGLGVDLGLRYALLHWGERTFTCGFSGQNLNQPEIAESGGAGVPRRLVLGLGYEDRLYVAEVDLELVDGDSRVRVGGEYRFGGRSGLRLRAGASGIAGDSAAGELDGGLGLSMGKLTFNWAYHYASEITVSGTQRFSLGYQF